MDERYPKPRRGIPLRDLREHEDRLRFDREDNGATHTGSTPIPVERENTSRLAGEITQHVMTGNMAPVDMENLIDRLALKLVEKGGGAGSGDGGGSGRRTHPEANAWIRWSLGAVVAVLSAWWIFQEKLTERPTIEQLKELRAPELEAVKRHEFEIREQRDSIIEMSSTLKQVSQGVSEIKAELKSR